MRHFWVHIKLNDNFDQFSLKNYAIQVSAYAQIVDLGTNCGLGTNSVSKIVGGTIANKGIFFLNKLLIAKRFKLCFFAGDWGWQVMNSMFTCSII